MNQNPNAWVTCSFALLSILIKEAIRVFSRAKVQCFLQCKCLLRQSPHRVPFTRDLLLASASATILNNFERKDVLGSISGIHYSETRQEPFLLGKECLQTLIVKEKPAWLISSLSSSSVFCKCFNIAYLDSSSYRPPIHFGLKK